MVGMCYFKKTHALIWHAFGAFSYHTKEVPHNALSDAKKTQTGGVTYKHNFLEKDAASCHSIHTSTTLKITLYSREFKRVL
jgi:hypothetical protein